jgi:hypothetical protein
MNVKGNFKLYAFNMIKSILIKETKKIYWKQIEDRRAEFVESQR